MRRAGLAALAALVVLAGCADDEDPRLEGERVAVRAPDAGQAAIEAPRPIPPATPREEWSQRGGDAANTGGHIEGPASLSQAWVADAGQAISAGTRPSGPVVVGGRVFVRDGGSGVLAFDAGSGQRLWRVDMTPEGERGDAGHGGGVAADAERVYVTTGFGEIAALSPQTGERLWSHGAEAPFGAGPAVRDGLVAAVSRGGRALGLSAADGTVLWRAESSFERGGNLPGAAPALTGGVAAIPYGSGELQLLRAQRGLRLWTVTLFSPGSMSGLATFTDVTSDPVTLNTPQGPLVVAGNAGGALAAFDGRSGRQVWRRTIGSLSPVWAAGDAIFVATTEPKLQRLDLYTGRTLWSVDLAAWEDPEDREGPITYAGPVLVGGRLLTTSSDGRLMSHDPLTGAELGVLRMPGGSTTGPVVAGRTVYVLTDDGRLIAYR